MLWAEAVNMFDTYVLDFELWLSRSHQDGLKFPKVTSADYLLLQNIIVVVSQATYIPKESEPTVGRKKPEMWPAGGLRVSSK